MNPANPGTMNLRSNPILLCLGLATLFAGRVQAQQTPMYTTYMWNMMTVNPAYAGSADVMNATATARRQWVGLDGAPTTNSILVHSPLRLRSLGLGLSVIDDRIGPSRSGSYFVDFAYRIQVTKTARLAFGLKAGGNTMRMDLADVSGTNANDPVYQRSFNGGFSPNFGFGLFYWSRKGYVGLSTPKLLKEQFVGATETGDVRLYTQQLHYFLTAGYVFPLSKEVKFKPSLLLKAVGGAPLSADLSANFLFMERFWSGMAYRTSGDVAMILSYQATDQLRAGYSYDMTTSALMGQQGGSHEIMLSYDLAFTKRMLRSPRYF